MSFNTPNVIVKDVFTNDEIYQIWKSVDASTRSAFIETHCQLNKYIDLPDHITNKFISYAKSITGNENLELTEYCYARYQNTELGGKRYRPSLYPHYDETFKEERFTFDYQLDSNIDWDIVVEDKTLSLKNNQAGTFSGTHQIHWRTPIEFRDDQYVEMIFCHFTDPTSKIKEKEIAEKIDQKAKEYRNVFYSQGGFSNGRDA